MKINSSLPLEYSTEQNRLRIFGFWVFLAAEVVLFATLFTVYAILHTGTGSGPTGKDIFEISGVIWETFILLTSSFTIGLAVNAMRLGNKKAMLAFLAITLLLGLGFLGIEISEFFAYVDEGAKISTSAFLSSLFVTLGTHGAHVTFGFFWGLMIFIQIAKRGFNADTANKAFIFSLYWHFLDVVWIFIFSFIYLKGLM
ncbi:cytochrome c oxidase subunit 3 [Bacillus sp. 1P06AnD]|uniref:cytochrome c oxidase subunit 3 n=1 Tax=Bacillus sp. 1P06AnD TaxID=3132208 RepID=UPI00399F5B3B